MRAFQINWVGEYLSADGAGKALEELGVKRKRRHKDVCFSFGEERQDVDCLVLEDVLL